MISIDINGKKYQLESCIPKTTQNRIMTCQFPNLTLTFIVDDELASTLTLGDIMILGGTPTKYRLRRIQKLKWDSKIAEFTEPRNECRLHFSSKIDE